MSREVDRRRFPAHALTVGCTIALVAVATAAGRADEGPVMTLDREVQDVIAALASGPPLSFTYDGKSSQDLLPHWQADGPVRQSAEDRGPPFTGRPPSLVTTWTDPDTGLRVRAEVIRFTGFPAVEWLLHFENTGTSDTPIIENIQTLDLGIAALFEDKIPYRLHRTRGGLSNPTDFEAAAVKVGPRYPQLMSAGAGRSSNRDFPFFKIETGLGSLIVAVGWSGQWKATLECSNQGLLHVRAGMQKTHFLLHPGEKVRMPRMLIMHWPGDTLEANAQFRQLIYKHYTATRSGEKLLPTLYCNTCFTRLGGWLNECNAENQISLINAYAPLGLEALLTDAGWFEGGWPAGAGNWTPRKDAYPDGMGPVAAAAKSKDMIYGLWFEPERVVAGTWLHENHPEWLLGIKDPNSNTYLANFGLPEVRDYFFNIVKGFMDLPGFRVYRQDFNRDPLRYWRDNEAPDRKGITEIRYIEGLYEYWERIARTWPDSLRIECASGGRRIDLETVMRMHVHQKSDFWFHNEVDQASIWGLSQYLPNNLFMAPINRMDDYTFHSVMATSLCMGWIADAPDFDYERGKKLLDRYRQVRHLLIGAWYPLLPYSREEQAWMGSQYHRPDLNEGMILVFRHEGSPYPTANLKLYGLDADATYEVVSDRTGQSKRASGQELMTRLELKLQPHESDLIVYRKVK